MLIPPDSGLLQGTDVICNLQKPMILLIGCAEIYYSSEDITKGVSEYPAYDFLPSIIADCDLMKTAGGSSGFTAGT